MAEGADEEAGDFVQEAFASASAFPSPKCIEKEKQVDDKDGVPKAPGKKRKAADEAGAHARKCQLVKEARLKRCSLSHLTPTRTLRGSPVCYIVLLPVSGPRAPVCRSTLWGDERYSVRECLRYAVAA